MDRRITWRYFLILIAAIIILILIGDLYLKNLLISSSELYSAIRSKLYLTGAVLIGVSIFLYILLRWRIVNPINRLVTNLKQHLGGSSPDLEALHQPSDIGPLLYTIEAVLKSFQLEIQDVEAEFETLSSVLEQITDGIVMVNDQGEISGLNPAAEEIFSIPSEQAQGHTVAEILRHHQWIELYRNCLLANGKLTATLEIPSQQIFLQGIAIPPGDPLPGHTLMVFQDLSEIRRLETTRQDFISNISHELRTPLASLKALTDTLQEGALDDPAYARRFLNRMETEVDALTQMVTELLELSRIESGRVPLNLTPVSPIRLLENADQRMRAQAHRKKLSVQVQSGDDLPLISADLRRIEQVLVNLLHNAIKFSDPGEDIILSARQEDNEVVFCVEDFGAGIPENDLERIFERFYKTDQARSSGGTGLGLSIAKHIVESHAGKIWAESSYGEGSRVSFSIPLEANQL